MTWLARRFGVMLRAAMKASGKASSRRKHRADEGHDDGLQQLQPDVAMLPFGVVEDVVPGERGVGLVGIDALAGDDQRRRPRRTILPQNGEFVSKTKFAQPRKRCQTMTSSLCTSARPESRRDIGSRALLRCRSSLAAAQAGSAVLGASDRFRPRVTVIDRRHGDLAVPTTSPTTGLATFGARPLPVAADSVVATPELRLATAAVRRDVASVDRSHPVRTAGPDWLRAREARIADLRPSSSNSMSGRIS